jgi:hypothetical protein
MDIFNVKRSTRQIIAQLSSVSGLLNTDWREGRERVELLHISICHDSGSLRIGSLCSERFVIPADLSRHRYVVTLSHLETLFLFWITTLNTCRKVVTCGIYFLDIQYPGYSPGHNVLLLLPWRLRFSGLFSFRLNSEIMNLIDSW